MPHLIPPGTGHSPRRRHLPQNQLAELQGCPGTTSLLQEHQVLEESQKESPAWGTGTGFRSQIWREAPCATHGQPQLLFPEPQRCCAARGTRGPSPVLYRVPQTRHIPVFFCFLISLCKYRDSKPLACSIPAPQGPTASHFRRPADNQGQAKPQSLHPAWPQPAQPRGDGDTARARRVPKPVSERVPET